MKLYLFIIGFSMIIISAINIVFDVASVAFIIISVFACTVLQFALDGLIAFIINKMPDKLFSVENPLYYVSKAEEKLYKKLKVRKWKDKVWELGGLGGFSKRKLLEPDNPKYIEKFIIECNKGVLTHRLSYPIGFLPILFMPNLSAFTVALPIAAVNLFLNILPTLALRYNTPKLKSIYKRMNKFDSEKQQNKS